MAGTETAQQGWARRLTRDCWRYRKQCAARARRLAGRHGRHGAGPAGHQADHRRRHRRARPLPRPLGRPARRRRGRRLRPHLHPPLLRRPPRPGRPARPAHRDVRRHRPARRPAAGRAEHRPGRRPRHQRPPADPGPALHAPDDDRERPALRDLPRRHGGACRRCSPSSPLAVAPALWFIAKRSRARLFPATWYAQGQAAAVAGVVDGAVSGVRVVKGFGQEEQETGKLREVSRRLFAGRLRTVRLNARYTPALQAVPALGQVAMLAPRRLDGHPGPGHPRHLRRLLHLPRPAGRPGPDARR